MLAFLRGTIIAKADTSLILDVHDVGYRVFSTEAFLHRVSIDEPISLFIYQHIREDGNDLYGFPNADELSLFERLISISGVGPKTALSALSRASAEGIKQAIAKGDAGLLRTVSGIGAKTSERIVIELKGVFASEGLQAGTTDDRELIDALVGLGYTVRDASDTIHALPKQDMPMEERLKAALKSLGGRH